MASTQSFQLTLAILKPHVVKTPFVLQKIRSMITESNFKVVRSRTKTITMEEAEFFYEEHKGKFFYNRLLTFITSGPSDIYVLANDDAIVKWRTMLGPTKSYQAQFTNPESIRGLFGLSDTRNAAHGSDSPESAEREIKVFFEDFNTKEWFLKEKELFRLNKVKFDPLLFVHKIDENAT